MSCITELLKLKGDKEFYEGIEGGGHYKGYEYLITFNDNAIRCGYIAIPENHVINLIKTHKEFYDKVISKISCYGGITFDGSNHPAKQLLGEHPCQDIWVGFDCMHYHDIYDIRAFKKYYPEEAAKDMERYARTRYGRINNFEEMKRIYGTDPRASVKNYSFVDKECKNIINQLIKLEQ